MLLSKSLPNSVKNIIVIASQQTEGKGMYLYNYCIHFNLKYIYYIRHSNVPSKNVLLRSILHSILISILISNFHKIS